MLDSFSAKIKVLIISFDPGILTLENLARSCSGFCAIRLSARVIVPVCKGKTTAWLELIIDF